MWSDDAVLLGEGARRVAWSRLTGRSMPLPEEELSPGVLARLSGLGLVRGSPRPDPAALVPCRSRLVLVRAEQPALWFPAPDQHTSGGHAWGFRRLDPAELAIWRAIDDRRKVPEIARKTGLDIARILSFFAVLTDPALQALQLRDAPAGPREPGLERVIGGQRADHARTPDQRGASGETTLTAWHLAITDGDRHFDDRETTVAHAHGLPHPGLRGRRYGEALYDALSREAGTSASHQIFEVGCGDGELMEAFLGRDPALAPRVVRVDLSPELLRTQARRTPGTAGVLGDATRLPVRDACADLLISNEVIADLSAIPGDAPDPELRARLARYGIPAGKAACNLGAWKFVEEIARVLAPGGRAFLSEFGGEDEDPTETAQLDHPEVSIRFGDLLAVARGCGLRARLVPLDSFLGFDLHARQLCRVHFQGLRAMSRAEGRHLPARSWTPETLKAEIPWPVEGLRFVPISEPGPGPLVTRFMALILEKPSKSPV